MMYSRQRSLRAGKAKGVGTTLLAGVFFFSNVVAVYAAESNFWADRKAAADRLKGGPSSNSPHPATASVPPSNSRQLLAQLPSAAHVDFGQAVSGAASALPLSMSLGNQLADFHSVPTAGSEPSVAEVSRLVAPYGSIREIHLSRTAKAPLIIHVQDAHGIEEAQRNMAQMVRALSGNGRPLLVGVEGASGGFDLEPYRNFPDASITQDIADYLLKDGAIGGPEHAGLTAPQAPTLWGIEDLDLYVRHVETLQKSLAQRPALSAVLSELRASADHLKASLYSPELREFDRRFTAYQNREEGLGLYVRYLMGGPGTRGKAGPKAGFPNLSWLMDALDQEAALDFPQVEKERLKLVDALAERLSEAQLSRLVQQSLEHRQGRLTYGRYHRYLRGLCRAAGIVLADFPQLNSYMDYVELADRIDRHKLLGELDRLETQVQDSLARGPEQTRLIRASRHIVLLEKLARHEMTPTDWAAYERQRNTVLGIAKDLEGLGAKDLSLSHKEPLQVLIQPFEQFCEYAVRRNGALVKNLLAKVNEDSSAGTVRPKKIPAAWGRTPFARAALVAGGFHSDGITEILRRQGLSYMVVTPKITEVPKDHRYLDVFARDPLPLEKLFAGEKIFLKYPLLTVSRVPHGLSWLDFRRERNRLQNRIASLQALSLLDKTLRASYETEEAQKRAVDSALESVRRELRTLGIRLDVELKDSRKFLDGTDAKVQLGREGDVPAEISGVVARRNAVLQEEVKRYISRKGNQYVGAVTLGEKVILFYGAKPNWRWRLVERILPEWHSPIVQELRLTRSWDRRVAHRRKLDPAVGVFGGARLAEGSPSYVKAEALGRELAKNKFRVRTGAGPGAMDAVPRGANGWAEELPEESVFPEGVRIKVPFEQTSADSIPNMVKNKDGDPFEYEFFPVRKQGLFHNLAGVVAVPGGYGTFDEIFETIRQNLPLVLYGVEYWQPILEAMKDAGLFKSGRFKEPHLTDDPAEAVEYIKRETEKIKEGKRTVSPIRSDLRSITRMVWQVIRSLRRLKRMPAEGPVVFVGGEDGVPAAAQHARGLVRRLAEAGVRMRAGNRTAHQLIREEPGTENVLQSVLLKAAGDPGLTEEEKRIGDNIVVSDGPIHRFLLVQNAGAYVFLPDTPDKMVGRLNVLFDVITQIQTGKIPPKPVLLVGKDFWSPLMDVLSQVPLNFPNIEDGARALISPEDPSIFKIVDSADEAAAELRAAGILNEPGADSGGGSSAGDRHGQGLHSFTHGRTAASGWRAKARLLWLPAREWLETHHRWEGVAGTVIGLAVHASGVSLAVVPVLGVVIASLHVRINRNIAFQQALHSGRTIHKASWMIRYLVSYVGISTLVLSGYVLAAGFPFVLAERIHSAWPLAGPVLAAPLGVSAGLAYRFHALWDRVAPAGYEMRLGRRNPGPDDAEFLRDQQLNFDPRFYIRAKKLSQKSEWDDSDWKEYRALRREADAAYDWMQGWIHQNYPQLEGHPPALLSLEGIISTGDDGPRLTSFHGGLGVLFGEWIRAIAYLGGVTTLQPDSPAPEFTIFIPDYQRISVMEVDGFGYPKEAKDSSRPQSYGFAFFEDPALPGRPLEVEIPMNNGPPARVRFRLVRVGAIQVIMPATDFEENHPSVRDIFSDLYKGHVSSRERFEQEWVYGLAAYEFRRRLGLPIDGPVHLNETATFAYLIGLVRGHMEDLVAAGYAAEAAYEHALRLAGGQTVFFTHTLVAAGLDFYDESVAPLGHYVNVYFGRSEIPEVRQHSGPVAGWMIEGKQPSGEEGQSILPRFRSPWGIYSPLQFVVQMAYRFGGRVVAVSQLNAQKADEFLVQQKIVSQSEVDAGRKVLGITNGVDHLFWMIPEIADIMQWKKSEPSERKPENILDPTDPMAQELADSLNRRERFTAWQQAHAEPILGDREFFDILQSYKADAINMIRERVRKQYVRETTHLERVLEDPNLHDPDVVRQRLHDLRVRWARWVGLDHIDEHLRHPQETSPEAWVTRWESLPVEQHGPYREALMEESLTNLLDSELFLGLWSRRIVPYKRMLLTLFGRYLPEVEKSLPPKNGGRVPSPGELDDIIDDMMTRNEAGRHGALTEFMHLVQSGAQFVFAGKTFGSDGKSQVALLHRVIERLSQIDPIVQDRVIFLEGYDETESQPLQRAIDKDLNTPARPLEASGTSGMKPAMGNVIASPGGDGWNAVLDDKAELTGNRLRSIHGMDLSHPDLWPNQGRGGLEPLRQSYLEQEAGNFYDMIQEELDLTEAAYRAYRQGDAASTSDKEAMKKWLRSARRWIYFTALVYDVRREFTGGLVPSFDEKVPGGEETGILELYADAVARTLDTKRALGVGADEQFRGPFREEHLASGPGPATASVLGDDYAGAAIFWEVVYFVPGLNLLVRPAVEWLKKRPEGSRIRLPKDADIPAKAPGGAPVTLVGTAVGWLFLGAGAPVAALIVLSVALAYVFSFSHPNRTGRQRIWLGGVGFLLSWTLFAPFLLSSLPWASALEAGLQGHILVHLVNFLAVPIIKNSGSRWLAPLRSFATPGMTVSRRVMSGNQIQRVHDAWENLRRRSNGHLTRDDRIWMNQVLAKIGSSVSTGFYVADGTLSREDVQQAPGLTFSKAVVAEEAQGGASLGDLAVILLYAASLEIMKNEPGKTPSLTELGELAGRLFGSDTVRPKAAEPYAEAYGALRDVHLSKQAFRAEPLPLAIEYGVQETAQRNKVRRILREAVLPGEVMPVGWDVVRRDFVLRGNPDLDPAGAAEWTRLVHRSFAALEAPRAGIAASESDRDLLANGDLAGSGLALGLIRARDMEFRQLAARTAFRLARELPRLEDREQKRAYSQIQRLAALLRAAGSSLFMARDGEKHAEPDTASRYQARDAEFLIQLAFFSGLYESADQAEKLDRDFEEAYDETLRHAAVLEAVKAEAARRTAAAVGNDALVIFNVSALFSDLPSADGLARALNALLGLAEALQNLDERSKSDLARRIVFVSHTESSGFARLLGGLTETYPDLHELPRILLNQAVIQPGAGGSEWVVSGKIHVATLISSLRRQASSPQRPVEFVTPSEDDIIREGLDRSVVITVLGSIAERLETELRDIRFVTIQA